MAETEERLKTLCASYLGGEWQDNFDAIKCTVLTGGQVNQTYRCELEECYTEAVILKIYGSEICSSLEVFKYNGVAAESVVCCQLSSVGLGPKVLSVFDEGRIEQFIPGRNAEISELRTNYPLVERIAKKLCQFHQLSMPVSKKVLYIKKVKKYYSDLKLENLIEEFDECDRIHILNMFDFSLKSELEWIESHAKYINSPITFSHNDFHENNIIVSHSNEVIFCDFEMSGYNYRGFDIGYFMQNLCYNEIKRSEKIGWEFVYEKKYEEIENYFIKVYLNETQNYKNYDQTRNTFDHVKMEVKYFGLLAMLSFLAYSRRAVNTQNLRKTMTFDYVGQIMERYLIAKHEFQKKYLHMFL